MRSRGENSCLVAGFAISICCSAVPETDFYFQVGAPSTTMARCLAERYPHLRLVVQMNNNTNTPSATPSTPWLAPPSQNGALSADLDMSARITVTERIPGIHQYLENAAVYIIHLPSPSAFAPESTPAIQALLQEHLVVIRDGSSVLLILTARLLPPPGSQDAYPDVQSVARTRDLSMLHLANEGEIEMSELLSAVEMTQDAAGRLIITERLRSHEGIDLALVVRYQAC